MQGMDGTWLLGLEYRRGQENTHSSVPQSFWGEITEGLSERRQSHVGPG